MISSSCGIRVLPKNCMSSAPLERAVDLLRHPVEGDRRRFRDRVDVREHEFLRLRLREGRRAAGCENAGHAGAGAQQRAAIEQNAANGSAHTDSSKALLVYCLQPARCRRCQSRCELTAWAGLASPHWPQAPRLALISRLRCSKPGMPVFTKPPRSRFQLSSSPLRGGASTGHGSPS